MNSVLPRIYTRLDSTLCSRYIMVYATISAILTTEAMPTTGDSLTTEEAPYANTAFTTKISIDNHDICRKSSGNVDNSTTVCRHRINKCDLPEYCSNKGSCPSDVHLSDKTSCDFNTGVCYRGHCFLTNSPCGAFLSHTFPSERVTTENNHTNDIPTKTFLCNRREICVDGSCLNLGDIEDVQCPSSTDGKICSGKGFCTNEHRCVCSCGWFGTACQFNESTSDDVNTSHNSTNQSQSWCLPKENPPEVTQLFSTTLEESTSKPIGAGATENEEDSGDIASATLMANAIIGGSIALMFAVAVVFGATSIGFRKVRKKDRLRTMHQFRILSIFQPTKAQQRKLMKQSRPRYYKGYRERRNDISKNKDQRIILEPVPNHSNHTKGKQPAKTVPSRPKKGSPKLISETMV